MNIILKEIIKENYVKSIKLKVNEEQDNYVAPNVYWIAQSKFYESLKPTVILLL